MILNDARFVIGRSTTLGRNQRSGPFFPLPPPPLPPLPRPLQLPYADTTADTAATVLASEAVYTSLRGLQSSAEDLAGNSKLLDQRRTNSAGNPNVYFYKSDPYRERHPGFIY